MKASSDKSKQIKKIVVKAQDELTDILQTIGGTDNGRIQLTFTEFSDLLVSPINLKVIQEVTDEQDKTLILQIINNPAGIRNAQEARVLFTDSANIIEESLWERASHTMEERQRSQKDKLKKSNASKQTPKRTVIPPTTKQKGDKDTVEEMVGDISQELGLDPHKKTTAPTPLPNQPEEKSAYSKAVEQAINKSKQVIEQGGVRVIKSGAVEIALDEDITKVQNHQADKKVSANEANPTMGKNISTDMGKITPLSSSDLTGGNAINKVKNKLPKSSEFKYKLAEFLKKLKRIIGNLGARITRFIKSKGARKGALIIFIPLLLTLVFGIWLTLQFAPLVKIKAKITSSPIEISKTFTGDPSITEFNLEAEKIRVKKESIEQELSDNKQASGTAARGEKAGGSVTIKCGYGIEAGDPDSVTLNAGSKLVSNGKDYITVSDIFLACPTQASVTVQATEVGEEYNLDSGSLFTIPGYPPEKLAGVNDGADLSGGSKETYTVISQQDINDLSKDLQKTAEKEANSKFGDLETDGWILIKSTIKHELDGDVETDQPVGTEADLFNLNLKIKSSALYYNEEDIKGITHDLLISTAKNKNLFANTGDDITLELDKDIKEEIKMEKVEGNKVTVSLAVSGAVVPKVDKERMIDYLRGMKWNDGISYLNGLEYFTDAPEISFAPTWIPKALWRFPSRQGRIFIDIKEVATEIKTDTTAN